MALQPKYNTMKYLIIIITLLFSSPMLIGQSGPCALTGDRDMDGLCDDIDPCPDTFNPNPVDLDGDNVYDACDNSPLFNPDQEDVDGDGIGDVSDPCVDPDGDGVCGADDKCPGGDDKIDIDFDGIPDGCDSCIDTDRDDICDDVDDCTSSGQGRPCDDGDPCTINDVTDEDCNCDGDFLDADEDGECDLTDKCPDSDDNQDFDNDGIPDGCDDTPNCTSCEADEKGKLRICYVVDNKAITLNATCEQLREYFNKDGSFKDGNHHCGPCVCADSGDVDSDSDGICDSVDPCPNDPLDSDGDGVCDTNDICPGSDDNQDGDDDGIPDGCDEINYCSPTYSSSFEWISTISLNEVVWDNRRSATLILHHSATAKLEKNKAHSLTVASEFIDNVCELSLAIYVDKNRDGDFIDGGEELYIGKTTESMTMDLNIDTYEEGSYRMRVILHYGRINGPCQEGIDGEVEDFLFEVIAQQPCSYVEEIFNYNIGTSEEELNGGEGWSDNWISASTDGGQIAIVTSLLSTEGEEGDGKKLGILNNAGSSTNMTRAINANLGGSSEFYFSIYLEKLSGMGTTTFSLGHISFGVNADGKFFLQDEVGTTIMLARAYKLQLKSILNHNGPDEITLAIIPKGSSTSGIEINTTAEMGDVIDHVSITFTSHSSFVPLVHYIDNITLGCDANFQEQNAVSNNETTTNRSSSILRKETSVELWPNPSIGMPSSIKIEGDQDVYNYKLTDVTGKVISQGAFFNGINKAPHMVASKGLFNLIIETQRKITTTKMIIQ